MCLHQMLRLLSNILPFNSSCQWMPRRRTWGGMVRASFFSDQSVKEAGTQQLDITKYIFCSDHWRKTLLKKDQQAESLLFLVITVSMPSWCSGPSALEQTQERSQACMCESVRECKNHSYEYVCSQRVWLNNGITDRSLIGWRRSQLLLLFSRPPAFLSPSKTIFHCLLHNWIWLTMTTKWK